HRPLSHPRPVRVRSDDPRRGDRAAGRCHLADHRGRRLRLPHARLEAAVEGPAADAAVVVPGDRTEDEEAALGVPETGLMLEKGTRDTLEADAVWAGICTGVLVIMFPFLFFETKRVDNGFRRHGLAPLAVTRPASSCCSSSSPAWRGAWRGCRRGSAGTRSLGPSSSPV